MEPKEEMKYVLKGSQALLSTLASIVTGAIAMGVFNEFGLYFKFTLATWLVFFNWKVLVVLACASLLLRLAVKKIAEKVKEYEDAKTLDLKDILNTEEIASLKKAATERYDHLVDNLTKRMAIKVRKALLAGNKSFIFRVSWSQPFCLMNTGDRARLIKLAQQNICTQSGIKTVAMHYQGYSRISITS